MNYSKKIREDNDDEKMSSRELKRAGLIGFKVFLVGLLIGAFGVCGVGLAWLLKIIKDAPDVSKLELKPKYNYTTFIYDIYGNEIDRLTSNKGEARIYATLDEIPYYLQKAIIAIEDSRFYQHNGVDIKGVMRAIVVNLQERDIVEGASTITQQLIKNNILGDDETFTRKIQEMYLALQFDKIYEIDLILEYYLNTLALGHGMNGVQAASDRYFKKDVSDLSLAECVVLAGITQSPTALSPINNPEANWAKAKLILSNMVDQGYITEAERQEALLEDPYESIPDINEAYIETKVSPHTSFVDAVIDAVLRDFVEEGGMTTIEASNMLYGGGVQIYTTFTPEIQQVVDRYINDESLYPDNEKKIQVDYRLSVVLEDDKQKHYGAVGFVQKKSEIEEFKTRKREEWGITDDMTYMENLYETLEPQASFVVIDHSTGYVPALSGGRGEKSGSRTFNRATQAKRQPGSVFKPLAAYAPALDTGLLSPGSVIMDEPLRIEITSKEIYEPKNHDGIYIGPSTMRRGIWHSVNTLAVSTVQLVGLDTAFDYVENFGFRTLLPTDKVYALPLGGLTEGVTTIDLAGAYAALANGGVYLEPILYTQVLDMDGNMLFDNRPNDVSPEGHQDKHQVVSDSTAYMLTDIMEDVIKIGTGWKLKQYFYSHPVSGKTGTTNDSKDLTFAGYTPYYTAAIWFGHDTPEEMTSSSTNHLAIWGKIMQDLHKNLEFRNFEPVTTGYVEATVCSSSGMKPTSRCSKTHTDYFRPEHLTEEYCTLHNPKPAPTPKPVFNYWESDEAKEGRKPQPVLPAEPEPEPEIVPQVQIVVPPIIPEPELIPAPPIIIKPDLLPEILPEPQVSTPEPEPQVSTPTLLPPIVWAPELLPPVEQKPPEPYRPPAEDEEEFFIP
ncbi:hypothetical protein AN642_01765 [Epulopiscium sp. SCG-B10WGA-EpuloA2]|nr:hypothetical protein AN642_01765 [Epulopiscium sp. SCG-B10WGA-EpuloA2]